ncbi:hypothetical protein H1S01_11650 [Heliobacterium chlorum]|uniref:Uncharacterized protein n=1 Tax=Heliobacterium chlorum TaxID=2698 RepID=A0ABR7T311_HELCL|nr:hypothetical protein [Heliobacterium chlorum]MBC9785163.1 hypothetical protein [Heliobacterium chlorum]
MRFGKIQYGLTVLFIFLSVIGGAMSLNLWATRQNIPTTATVTEDIRGWMTLKQVSEAMNIPVSEVKARLTLPVDTNDAKSLKELSSERGLSTEEFKERLFQK